MRFSKVNAKNFKSFDSLRLCFSDFNVVIGANASGKSNFLSLIRFLKDIDSWGLESAISLQGGRDYILNKNVGKKETLLIDFEIDSGVGRTHYMAVPRVGGYRSTYINSRALMEIKFKERGSGYKIVNNVFEVSFILEKGYDGNEEWEVEENYGEFTYGLYVDKKGNIVVDVKGDLPDAINLEDIFPLPVSVLHKLLDKDEPLFSQFFISILHPWREKVFKNLSIFDFSPNVVKSASPVVGKSQLEENASNLPVVLRRVLKKSSDRNRFVRILSDLLPFVNDVKISETNDKSLLLEIKESYDSKHYLPSTFLSDGTVHAVALMSALYFDEAKLAFFEEPERNLHPALVQKVVDHMKSHSSDKQIFVTTHNAELLRNVAVEDVFFVSRKSNGVSVMNNISHRKDVQAFLENEIGLDELYVQNLLG